LKRHEQYYDDEEEEDEEDYDDEEEEGGRNETLLTSVEVPDGRVSKVLGVIMNIIKHSFEYDGLGCDLVKNGSQVMSCRK
jgi:hypothetical protein